MRTRTGSRLLFVLALSALLLAAGPRLAYAQGADDFNIPNTDASAPSDAGGDAGGGTPPAEAAAGGAETPANPEEAPGAPPAEAATGNIGAEGAGDAANAAAPAVDEPEQIEMLAANHKFTPSNPSKDPFKPLVEKKVVLPPPPPPSSIPKSSSAPPPPPPPKPIQLVVTGVCGNDNERLALITFEGKPYTVQKDQVIDGKFKVVDVMSDRLVIYSNKEQMRRTFPIGGGGKD